VRFPEQKLCTQVAMLSARYMETDYAQPAPSVHKRSQTAKKNSRCAAVILGSLRQRHSRSSIMHCAAYIFCIALILAARVQAFITGIPATRSAHVFSMRAAATSNTQKLRDLLAKGEILTMPCCYDGLTARLIEQVSITNFSLSPNT
jgi:hypothetical protein